MPPVRGQLGVTEVHAHAVPGRPFEQRPNGGIGHLFLKPNIGLRPVGVVPARKKGRQRQLGVNNKVGTPSLGLIHQVEHPGDDDLARIGFLYGTELGGSNRDNAGHGLPFFAFFSVWQPHARAG